MQFIMADIDAKMGQLHRLTPANNKLQFALVKINQGLSDFCKEMVELSKDCTDCQDAD